MTKMQNWSVGLDSAIPAGDMKAAQRQRIMLAADRLLARRGFRGMTIEDVAVEAGIGKGTTYLYFRSKEELALAVVDAHIHGTLERLRKLAGSDAPPRRRLEEMAVARVLDRLDRLHHYGEGLHEMLAALRPALLRQRDRQLRLEARIFVPVLRELAGSGRSTGLVRIAAAMLTATNSLLPYYLSSRQLGAREVIARRARDVARLAIAGAVVILRKRERSG
jgi:AcrR family transcriptional regulator